jgi:hypothetical protein
MPWAATNLADRYNVPGVAFADVHVHWGFVRGVLAGRPDQRGSGFPS